MTHAVENGGVKKVYIDDVLLKLSAFGRYHVGLGICVWVACMLSTIAVGNYIFVAEKVNYRCKSSTSYDYDIIPLNQSSGEDQCYLRVSLNDSASTTYDENSKRLPCTEWVYDDPNSFAAEFQLACQDWKLTSVGSIHMAGYTAGLIITGVLSDRFGRKPLLIMLSVIGGLIGTLRSFVGSYTLYVALEFLEGAIGDSFVAAYVMYLESVAAKYRVLYTTIIKLSSSTGHILLGCLAWYFRDWRSLLRVIYIPQILIISYIFFIDESPRWLLTKKRKDSAVAILQKAGRRNNQVSDKREFDGLTSENNQDMKFLDSVKTIFKSKILMRRFLICVVIWIVSCYNHYGVLVNSVLLSGNKYVNYLLLNVSAYPGTVLLYYLLEKHRRKMPLVFGFFSAAVCFGIQPFVPESTNLSWLPILMLTSGQVLTNICFSIIYIYTLELFPTDTRSSMLSLCSTLGRIGSLLGPQTPLLVTYWTGLPSITFAAASLAAAGLTLLVPDTEVEALPDSVRQAELVGNRSVTKTKL